MTIQQLTEQNEMYKTNLGKAQEQINTLQAKLDNEEMTNRDQEQKVIKLVDAAKKAREELAVFSNYYALLLYKRLSFPLIFIVIHCSLLNYMYFYHSCY